LEKVREYSSKRLINETKTESRRDSLNKGDEEKHNFINFVAPVV